MSRTLCLLGHWHRWVCVTEWDKINLECCDWILPEMGRLTKWATDSDRHLIVKSFFGLDLWTRIQTDLPAQCLLSATQRRREIKGKGMRKRAFYIFLCLEFDPSLYRHDLNVTESFITVNEWLGSLRILNHIYLIEKTWYQLDLLHLMSVRIKSRLT